MLDSALLSASHPKYSRCPLLGVLVSGAIAAKAGTETVYLRMYATQFSLKGAQMALFATTSVRMWRICVANRSVSNRSTRSGRGPDFTYGPNSGSTGYPDGRLSRKS